MEAGGIGEAVRVRHVAENPQSINVHGMAYRKTDYCQADAWRSLRMAQQPVKKSDPVLEYAGLSSPQATSNRCCWWFSDNKKAPQVAGLERKLEKLFPAAGGDQRCEAGQTEQGQCRGFRNWHGEITRII